VPDHGFLKGVDIRCKAKIERGKIGSKPDLRGFFFGFLCLDQAKAVQTITILGF
jgi:hypothetical protein